MLQKLELGTVQFGIPYGVNNGTGVVERTELKEIFDSAAKAGIKFLDTAPAYGDAEKKIGEYSNHQFEIITKLSAIPEGLEEDFNYLQEKVNLSKNDLKVDVLSGLLLHSPNQLLSAQGEKIYKGLQKLKTEGLVEKIGISIYQPDELDALMAHYDFDIVQSPFNIIDRRLIDSGWLKRLKDKNVEVHVRSIFLQGLLLMGQEARPDKFSTWNAIWTEFHNWLHESKLTALEACLRYPISIKEIDHVIFGIDNLSHLKTILKAAVGHLENVPDGLSSNDIKLINPLSWLEF